MNRKGKAVCALLLVQLLAWGVFVPTADAGKLVRVSAQFRLFAGGVDTTTAVPSATPGAGGVQVYSKSFSIPAPKAGQQAVVFITMAGTGQVPGQCSQGLSLCGLAKRVQSFSLAEGENCVKEALRFG